MPLKLCSCTEILRDANFRAGAGRWRSFYLSFFSLFLVCISRTGEPVGIRTGSADLGPLLLFFCSLGRQRAEDRPRLRSSHLSSSSSLHMFLFLLRIFILSSLCPTLLPISSPAHPSSSLCRYPVSLITLLCLFIIHLCYVTDTFSI